MPPMPNKGKIASDKTIIPIPPIQWVKARHQSRALGNCSMSVNMVAPVVVKPDMDSKKESVIEGMAPLNK